MNKFDEAQSLLVDNFGLCKKFAVSGMRLFNGTTFDDNFSIAMSAVWECAQKWNGKGAFEAISFHCYKLRLVDSIRSSIGKSDNVKQRRGSKSIKFSIDEEIDGRLVADSIPDRYLPTGDRLDDIIEEIKLCSFTKRESVLVELLIIQNRPIQDVASVMKVTRQRVTQIKDRVLLKIRLKLNRTLLY